MKVALLVGVSKYQKGFKPLPSAVKDVAEMKQILENPNLGGFDKVTDLTNPNRQQLEDAIYHLFANRDSDDVVLFYFSGHGVKNMKSNLFFTVPETKKNTREEILPHTGVSAQFVQERMTDCRCERQVIILDCCFSGAFAKGLTAKDDGKIDIQGLLGGKGRAILTSSTSMQLSFQQDDSGLSVYTHYLTEGLKTGAASINNRQWITADEAHKYASKKVEKASPAMTPQFFPVAEGYEIYLVKAVVEDPKLKYRQEVERIIQEDDGEIDFITGKFSDLDRIILDEFALSLKIEETEAKAIEKEVIEPYRQRQQKINKYERAFSVAIKKNNPLRETDIQKLKRFQDRLGLSDEDIAPIKQKYQLKSSDNIQTQSTDNPPKLTIVNPVNQPKTNNFTEDLGNGVKLEMIYIPAGEFMMGTDDAEIERLCKKYNTDWFKSEAPQHLVKLQSFYLGKYPITQAQYQAVMGKNPSKFQNPKEAPLSKGGWGDHPVERVSWNDAQEFCQQLSQLTDRKYRLPSESQWEYACRAGSKTKWCFGDDENQLKDYAWYYSNSSNQTHPVEQKKPNDWGLYDMHGNVWEWCEDNWHDNYQNAPDDGKPWLDPNKNLYVIRGGSWFYIPGYCRSACRFNEYARVFYIFGFRVVCG